MQKFQPSAIILAALQWHGRETKPVGVLPSISFLGPAFPPVPHHFQSHTATAVCDFYLTINHKTAIMKIDFLFFVAAVRQKHINAFQVF
ncbi:hypothetical protein D6779_11970 [Candidatus Parcubacteria bacterium]|nr:MAG: hypothetical protein D6779_11970 [Candidatus Parcubacteria bacterium]